jgi:hypothetical protein
LPSVPWDQLQDSPLAPFLGDWPAAPSPLWAFMPLSTSARLPFLRGWLVAPSHSQTMVLDLCSFTENSALRFGSLPHPSSPEQIQCSTPPPLSVLDYSLLFILFSFVGYIQSPQELHWIMFSGDG